MVRITHWGPWAFSDSASYLSAARNFNRGLGFVILNSNGSLTHVTEFPPFYPIFLSFFVDGNHDPSGILRWVNIGLLVIFLILLGSLLFKATRNSLLAWLGMLLCVTSPVLLEVFSGVMSETLFLPLLCLLFLLTLRYLERENTTNLVLLCVFSCLLPITRYAGILFVCGITLILLLFSRKDTRLRWCNALIYLAASLLPVGFWFLRLYTSFKKVGGKSFSINFSLFQNLFNSMQAEFNVLKNWLPYYGIYRTTWIDQLVQYAWPILFLGLVIYAAWKFTRNSKNEEYHTARTAFALAVINLCAYLLFIAFTHSITIPQIDITDRMLAPIIPLLAVIPVMALFTLPLDRKRIPVAAILALAILVLLRFDFLKSLNYAEDMEINGHGYTARQYQESGIVDAIKAIPEDQRMISNDAGFILYYTNRFPVQIDQFANRVYGRHNGYGEKSFREKGAALILLYPEFRNYYGNTANDLLNTVTKGLTVHYQDAVGGIYYYPLEWLTQP